MAKYEAENRRPLVGAVVTADSVKRVVLEDDVSATLRDEAVPHVLRCIAGKLESGGVTLRSAQAMSRVKSSLGSALQPIIARYDMCLLLGDGGAAPDTLTEDLLSTAFRASAVSIIATSMRVLDPTDHCDLLGTLDEITFDLERRSTDIKQFSFLKSPKVFSAILEAAQETTRVLSVAARDYKKEKVEFAEPLLFERIRLVFIDSASRLGFQ